MSALIAQARAAGFTLHLADGRLRVAGPVAETEIVAALRTQSAAVQRWLANEAVEYAWREQVFRSLVPARGPVLFLKLDGDDAAGCCLDCRRRTEARDWTRCPLCLRALRAALGIAG